MDWNYNPINFQVVFVTFLVTSHKNNSPIT